MTFHRYRAYGLGIHSEFAIAELPIDDTALPDVVVRRRRIDGPMPTPDQIRLVRCDDRGIYLAWSMLGRFLVAPCGTIDVDAVPGAELSIGSAIIGPAMAALLHQRGHALLHGSAVAVAGQALLFLGAKGAGKSTTAAAMVFAGAQLLNDDVIPFEAGMNMDRRPSIIAGFPLLKLSAEAHARLMPDAMALAPVGGAPAKLRIRTAPVRTGEIPVGMVYILNDRHPEVTTRTLDSMRALTELLPHGYALKFGERALAGAPSERLFRQCSALAQHVPVRSVCLPKGIDALALFAARTIRDPFSA